MVLPLSPRSRCAPPPAPPRPPGRGGHPGSVSPPKLEVMEKYELYRDSVDGLPSCQLEVQLYQKKIQDLAENRDRLAGVLKEVRACSLAVGSCASAPARAAAPVPPPQTPVCEEEGVSPARVSGRRRGFSLTRTARTASHEMPATVPTAPRPGARAHVCSVSPAVNWKTLSLLPLSILTRLSPGAATVHGRGFPCEGPGAGVWWCPGVCPAVWLRGSIGVPTSDPSGPSSPQPHPTPASGRVLCAPRPCPS